MADLVRFEVITRELQEKELKRLREHCSRLEEQLKTIMAEKEDLQQRYDDLIVELVTPMGYPIYF